MSRILTPRIAAVMLVLLGVAIVCLTTWPFDFQLDGPAIGRKWESVEWDLFYRGPSGEVTVDLDLLLNVLLFFPLGVTFVLSGRRRRFWREAIGALAIGLGLSIFIEGLQLLTPERVSQLADVWRNALGAALGGVAAALLRSRLIGPDR